MDNITNSRRKFLKKAAYVAPTIIGLGALTLPVSAGASTFSAQIYFNDNDTIYDATAYVYGNSATGELSNPAGGVIKYTKGTEVNYADFDIAAVNRNNQGYFNFAVDMFDSITYNDKQNDGDDALITQ